ncbi:MAG TPA: STAS domain-containing protein [Marinagarivorans sp.]
MVGQISVASDAGTYAIRMTGDVRMVLCLSFDKFIRSMFADPEFDSVVFDLSAAEAVDSTTLGLMAKIALQCRKVGAPKPVLVVKAFGMVRLLETMGFEDIFVITDGMEPSMDNAERLNCEEGSESHFKQRVIDAHKVLMSLNEHNERAFKELVETLENN